MELPNKLLRLTQKEPDDATQEYVDILEQSAERGVDMVRQILTFAQGSSAGDGTAVDIVALLKEVVGVVRQGVPDSVEICQQGWLEENTPPEGSARVRIEVTAESTHLHQVFMNLCINARDAIPQGGVLTLSVEPSLTDEVTARKNIDAAVGHYVVLTVADTGTGILPEICDHIFDPFFTTKAPDEGIGLGLATVSGIVKQAGGFITVASEVDRGTQFKVFLPALEQP